MDTHTLAWILAPDQKLTSAAHRAIEFANTVAVSPVSFYEIAQKVRLGKWPEMESYVGDLAQLVQGQGMVIVPLSPEAALVAGLLDWPHRDPFDRILAATALVTGMDFISADTAFDAVPGLRRIW